MNWLAKMQYRYGRKAPKNLMLVVAGGQIAAWLVIMLVNSNVYYLLQLTRSGLMHLQLWRLVSFVFSPSLTMNPLFFALEVYLVYWIGTSLERAWGAFTFDVYFLLGMAGAWVACLLTGWGSSEALFYSLFFAFAWLFPDMQLMLFFVLPVKVKWLGWIAAAILLLQLIVGSWGVKVNVLLSLVNFALFFGRGAVQQARGEIQAYKRRRQWRDANRRWNG